MRKLLMIDCCIRKEQSQTRRLMEASLYTLKLPDEVQQNLIPLGEASKEAEQTNK